MPNPDLSAGTIETAPFGRTGHQSSRVLFGAAALSRVDQATADRTMELLLEHGINHIDVARGYGDAELRLGPWMETHRDRFFLASKTPSRDYATARSDIRESLSRLRTDQLDLIQLHSLNHPDEWDEALGPGGALEAAQEAREQGLVRFIGVTGHNWTIASQHYRALQRFDFDSVLMPWNWFMRGFRRYGRDFQRTVDLCAERGIAVQTIKSIARGPWAAGVERTHSTWYQPLEDPADIALAVRWILGQRYGSSGLFLNSSGDVTILPLLLLAAAAAAGAPPPDDAEMEAMAERTGLATIFGI